MGVLVGTSLVVIIPEGVETLYSSVAVAQSANAPPHTRDITGLNHAKRAAVVEFRGNQQDAPQLRVRGDKDSSDAEFGAAVIPGSGSPHNPAQPAEVKDGEVHILGEGQQNQAQQSPDQKQEQQQEKQEKPHEDHADHSSPHAWIGVALISGFILMYLIDKLPHYTNFGFLRKSQPRPYHISLDNLSSGLASPSANGHNVDTPFSGNVHSGSTPIATTTGLVIHAAADGIALGSSSSASNTKLSFIIFVAIILHKAPAAFGLSTVLLQQGLGKRGVRAHLLVFSLAAPAGAVITWILAHTLFSTSPSTAISAAQHEANVHWRTGMLLLFSAGTFLYVAMHTMQDVTNSSGAHSTGSSHSSLNALFDGHEMSGVSSGSTRNGGGNKHGVRDLIVSVVGMMLPLFLQIGHAH